MPATDKSTAPAADAEAVPELDATTAERSLHRGLISLAVIIAIVVGLILAVPGLHGVGREVERMPVGWLVAAVALELFSCLAFVLAFLQVFERAPIRFGARVALTEEALVLPCRSGEPEALP